jgi:putative heme-binding domain-containing protein
MNSRLLASMCVAGLVALYCHVARADDAYSESAQDEIVVEAVLRLADFDLKSSEKAKAAVLRYIRHHPGSERFFSLVRRFDIPEAGPLCLELATARPTESEGVEAARLLLAQRGKEFIAEAIARDGENAARLITALGLTGEAEIVDLLRPCWTCAERSLAVRAAAARAVGRHAAGEKELFEMVAAGKLPDDLKFTVANVLNASTDESIRSRAAKLLPLPPSANAEPLPPLAELVQMRGDPQRGREVFRTVGTCANCHTVAGEGKEVGPDLTEIGSKLSREAMFSSILDPSAGISHNYESYQAILDSGAIFSGVKLSETDQAVTLKSPEAIIRTIPREHIEELSKLTISLMPADLQKAMTVGQLVDVVEYLLTLTTGRQGEVATATSSD